MQEVNLRLGPREIRVPKTSWFRRWCPNFHITSNARIKFAWTAYEANIHKNSHKHNKSTLRHYLKNIFRFLYRRCVYGNNEIVIQVKSILTLLCLEVLNPFYVFQLFSFCLWIADNYYYYAMVILAMSSVGIIMAVFQTRRVCNFSAACCVNLWIILITKDSFAEPTQLTFHRILFRRGNGDERPRDWANSDRACWKISTWWYFGYSISWLFDALWRSASDWELHSEWIYVDRRVGSCHKNTYSFVQWNDIRH